MTWLRNQELSFLYSYRRAKNSNSDISLRDLVLLLLATMFLAFTFVNAEEEKDPDLLADHGILGSTWICDNCGYENYLSLTNCSICGFPIFK